MRRRSSWSGLALAVSTALAAWGGPALASEMAGDPGTNSEAMRLQYRRPASPDGTRPEAWVDVPGELYVAVGTTVEFRLVREDGQAWPDGQPVWSGTSGASGAGPACNVLFGNCSERMSDTVTVEAKLNEASMGRVSVVSHGDDTAVMTQVALDTDEPQVKRVGVRLQAKLWGIDIDNDLVLDDMYGHVTIKYRDVYNPLDETMHDGAEFCFDSGQPLDETVITQECRYHFEDGECAAATNSGPVPQRSSFAVDPQLDGESPYLKYATMAVKWFAPKISGSADEAIKKLTEKIVAWIEGGAKVVEAEASSPNQTGGERYGDVEVKFTVESPVGKTTIGKGYLGIWYQATTGQVKAKTDHAKVLIDGADRDAEVSAFASAVDMANGVGDNNGPGVKRSEAMAGATGNMAPDWSRKAPYVYYYCSCFYYNKDLYRIGIGMNGRDVVYQKDNAALKPDELWHKGFLFYRIPPEFQH